MKISKLIKQQEELIETAEEITGALEFYALLIRQRDLLEALEGLSRALEFFTE